MKNEKGYALLDIVAAITIITLIISMAITGNRAIFTSQEGSYAYYKDIREFSNHVESLYQVGWDDLVREGAEHYDLDYQRKITEYGTEQLRITSNIGERKIETIIERLFLQDDSMNLLKPIAVIGMYPEDEITIDTSIIWDSSSSYDPNGLDIIYEEWINKKTNYLSGRHSVLLRVKNLAGNWSDWEKVVFYVDDSYVDNPTQDIIEISVYDDLDLIRQYPDAYFVLVNDINISTNNWIPIGHNEKPFTGILDGNGYKINGLKINSSNDYNGLFGVIQNAEIKNIILNNVDIKGADYTRGIAGKSYNSTVENVKVTGKINGQKYTGGVIGYSTDELEKVVFNGTVKGSDYTGGVAGYSSGEIRKTSTDSTINGNKYVGGIVGYGDYNLIEDCYALGNVHGSSNVGGALGYGYYGYIKNTYSTKFVTGLSSGGLVGKNEGLMVTSSYWNTVSSGQLFSAGGSGRGPILMNLTSTFKNWDFTNVWKMDSILGFPRLR